MPFFFIDQNGLKHPSNQLWEYYGIRDPESSESTQLSLRQRHQQQHLINQGLADEGDENRALVAKDIMTHPVVTLYDDQNLQDAIAQFGKNNFRHLPVISRQGALVGLLSERDIIKCLYRDGLQSAEKFLNAPVALVMQKTVLTVSEDTELQYIVDSMRYESVGSLPVLGEALSSVQSVLPQSAQILGIITKSNLLPLDIS